MSMMMMMMMMTTTLPRGVLQLIYHVGAWVSSSGTDVTASTVIVHSQVD